MLSMCINHEVCLWIFIIRWIFFFFFKKVYFIIFIDFLIRDPILSCHSDKILWTFKKKRLQSFSILFIKPLVTLQGSRLPISSNRWMIVFVWGRSRHLMHFTDRLVNFLVRKRLLSRHILLFTNKEVCILVWKGLLSRHQLLSTIKLVNICVLKKLLSGPNAILNIKFIRGFVLKLLLS